MMYLFLAQSFAAALCLYAYWRERENHLTTAIDRDQACARASVRASVIDTMTSEIEGYKNERADLILRSRNCELRIEALEAQIERERIETGKINKNRLKLIAALNQVSDRLHVARSCKLKTEIYNIMVEL